ncbi:HlyD family secretion protein [Vibrio sp.]|uniref:HlyD family secretion protein n=1 Tax=Vibrio sp. TaxID=678 RepID=UPI003D13E277
MKVNFHLGKKQNPQSDGGVKVLYGQAKRGGYRLRWYLILALVISPLLFFAYYFLRTNILVIAPAIITSQPVTITATNTGIIGPVPTRVGTVVEAGQTLVMQNNAELEAQVDFIVDELLQLENNASDFDNLYKHSIQSSRSNLEKIQDIQRRFEEYKNKNQISVVDYASILSISNTVNSQLNDQLIAYSEAKRQVGERVLAGPVTKERRALMKELVTRRVQQQALVTTSPYPGRVVEIHVTEGQRVAEGDELITIAKNEVPQVVAYLDPKHLALAKVGNKVKVRFPDGYSLQATVSQEIEIVSKLPSQLVSPFEGQPAYLKVNLTLDKKLAKNYWIEGMTVEASF